jgi:quercetin dioxygenase-like cupin family protein
LIQDAESNTNIIINVFETWNIVKGIILITLDGEDKEYSKGESLIIYHGTKH